MWGAPETDLGEWHGGDHVVKLERRGRELVDVGTVADGDFVGGAVVGELLHGGVEHGSVGDEGGEGHGEAGETLIDCVPGGGAGEVDAVVVPGVVSVAQDIDLIGDVVALLEDVLDVSGF